MAWAVPSLQASEISEDVINAEFWPEKVEAQKSNQFRTEGQGIHSAQCSIAVSRIYSGELFCGSIALNNDFLFRITTVAYSIFLNMS